MMIPVARFRGTPEDRARPWRLNSLAWLTVLALWALVASPVESARPLSERAFADEVARAFRAQAPLLKISALDGLQLEAVNTNGEKWTLRIGAMYDAYLRSPDEKQALIDRYIARALSQETMALVATRSSLLPAIRSRTSLAILARSAASASRDGNELIVDEFEGDWVVVYRLGTSEHAGYLTAKSLASMNVPRQSVRDLAVENLRRFSGKVEVQTNALFAVVTAGAHFDTGLLLLNDLWQAGRIAVDGEVVVAILEPNGVLVTGSRNRFGLAKIKELAALGDDSTDRMRSARLLVHRQGRFQRFVE